MTLDNPDLGIDDDSALEDKFRAEAQKMTEAAAKRPAVNEDEDEPEGDEDNTPQDERPAPKEPEKHRVKITDDEESEVTLDELKASYQRQADYTRKTQALAEERRKLTEGPRSQYEQLNNQLIEQLKAFGPREPDESLLIPGEKYNPDLYNIQLAQFRHAQRELGVRLQEKQRLENERAEENRKVQSERQEQEFKRMISYVPEWADEKVRNEDNAKITHFLTKTLKASPEEVAAAGSSALALAVLRRAVQFEQANDQKALVAAKVKDAPPVQKPGAAKVENTDSEEVTRLKAALKRNPRDDRLAAQLFTAQDKQARARAKQR